MPPPRDVVIAFRVRPETARLIRQAARKDARSVSSFLSFFVQRGLDAEEQ